MHANYRNICPTFSAKMRELYYGYDNACILYSNHIE